MPYVCFHIIIYCTVKKPNVEINYQIQASAIEFHESFNHKVFNVTSCCFLFGKTFGNP